MPFQSYGDPDQTPSRLRRLGQFLFDHIRVGIFVVMISICLVIVVASSRT